MIWRREFIFIAVIFLAIVIFNYSGFFASIGETFTSAPIENSTLSAPTENAKPSARSEFAITTQGQTVSYDANNYNLTYHDEVPVNGLDIDVSGVQMSKGGSFSNNTGNYVPNYENSIYLSKTTGQSYMAPVIPLPAFSSSMPQNPLGFCGDTTQNMEDNCNSLPAGVCASTQCCVLLGGKKCVAGNQFGPTMGSNYSDMLIPNRDYYYYSGKCYGNCEKIGEPYSGGYYGPSEKENSATVTPTMGPMVTPTMGPTITPTMGPTVTPTMGPTSRSAAAATQGSTTTSAAAEAAKDSTTTSEAAATTTSIKPTSEGFQNSSTEPSFFYVPKDDPNFYSPSFLPSFPADGPITYAQDDRASSWYKMRNDATKK
jgi:hypothetical protein